MILKWFSLYSQLLQSLYLIRMHYNLKVDPDLRLLNDLVLGEVRRTDRPVFAGQRLRMELY